MAVDGPEELARVRAALKAEQQGRILDGAEARSLRAELDAANEELRNEAQKSALLESRLRRAADEAQARTASTAALTFCSPTLAEPQPHPT
jgi:hypothetical protein